ELSLELLVEKYVDRLPRRVAFAEHLDELTRGIVVETCPDIRAAREVCRGETDVVGPDYGAGVSTCEWRLVDETEIPFTVRRREELNPASLRLFHPDPHPPRRAHSASP